MGAGASAEAFLYGRTVDVAVEGLLPVYPFIPSAGSGLVDNLMRTKQTQFINALDLTLSTAQLARAQSLLVYTPAITG